MIGRLVGQLIQKQPPLLLIDVNGVGYEVLAPMSTFYALHKSDDSQIILLTHLVVREDQQTLFGFKTENERTLFRRLIKTNGVGPKLALAILSSIETNTFIQCIQQNDATNLVRIPGVGKKTAERLIIEMRDKLEQFADIQTTDQTLTSPQAMQDALAALNSLGYKPQVAKKAIAAIQQPDCSSEQLIRLALQQLAQG